MKFGDDGCCAIFCNSKYLKNLEVLNLYGKKIIVKIECGITFKSSKTININMKNFQNLKEINFGGNF